jgi:hypothetical protein
MGVTVLFARWLTSRARAQANTIATAAYLNF